MSVSLARGAAAAAVLIFSSQSAFADLSADQVWADWKAYMASTGYDISATETASGGSLTVSDLSMRMAIPDENSVFDLKMPEMTFSENGDGTVSVLFPKEFPVTFNITGEEAGEELTAEVNYSHDGSPMTVSGDAGEMTYDYASSKVTMTLGKVVAEGEELPAGIANAVITLNDLATKSKMVIAGVRSYDQKLSAASHNYDMGSKDPDSDDSGNFKGLLNSLSFTGTSSIPSEMNAADLTAMLSSGFGFDGTFAYASGNSSAAGVDGSENFGFESSSQGGSFAVAMDSFP